MAVIVRYIVVRNGEEKMTFATKKEADAHDKMLDVADELYEFLERSELKLDEQQREDISLLMAQHRDDVISILRGTKVKKPSPPGPASKPASKPDSVTADPAPKTKGKSKK